MGRLRHGGGRVHVRGAGGRTGPGEGRQGRQRAGLRAGAGLRYQRGRDPFAHAQGPAGPGHLHV